MNINLIRLCSTFNKKEIQNENDVFINDINNFLFEEDIELVEDASSPFSVIFIESGGVEASFKKMCKRLPSPILLLSNSLNNSLGAALEINSYCLQQNLPVILLTQGAREASEYIKDICDVVGSYNKIKNSSLGVIGEPSDWLIASNVDFPLVENKFGISLIKIGMNELYDEISKKKIGNIPHIKTLEKKFENHAELKKALYVYSALKRLVEKYHLSGFTIRCFDLIKEYKTTACLALALLNEEGIVAGCEGDIPSLITMYICSTLGDRPCFMANPSKIDLVNGTMLLSHCTCPLNLLTDYNLNTHFESGLGVAIEGTLPNEEVALIKLSNNLRHYAMLHGNVVLNKQQSGCCRTQITVEIDKEELFNYLTIPVGNHLVVTYGNISHKFAALITFVNSLFYDKK